MRLAAMREMERMVRMVVTVTTCINHIQGRAEMVVMEVAELERE
jgi:hypothetical protein